MKSREDIRECRQLEEQLSLLDNIKSKEAKNKHKNRRQFMNNV